MISLADLPLIDRWGAKRIDQAINYQSVTGAVVGILTTPALLLTARVGQSALRKFAGWPWGHVGFLVGWLISGYLALVLLANWTQIEDADS